MATREYPNDYLYYQDKYMYVYDPKSMPKLDAVSYRVLRMLERAHTNYHSCVQELKKNVLFDRGYWNVVGFTDLLWAALVTFRQPVSMDKKWHALDDNTRFIKIYIKDLAPIAIIDKRIYLYGGCYTIRSFQFD